MKRKSARIFTTLLSAAILCLPAAAHHGSQGYDFSGPKKTLKGTVTRFAWQNPHAQLYIDVKDEKGNVVNWGFETAGPNSLYRRGYRKGLIMPGITVTIQGYLAKDGSHTGNAHILTMEDGKVIPLGSETNPG